MNLLLSSYQTLRNALRRTIAPAKASMLTNQRSHSTASPVATDGITESSPPIKPISALYIGSPQNYPLYRAKDTASREEELKKRVGNQPVHHDEIIVIGGDVLEYHIQTIPPGSSILIYGEGLRLAGVEDGVMTVLNATSLSICIGVNNELAVHPCVLEKDDMGDDLCKYCPLEKKGVYGVPGGYMAGCEGSRCDEAYENYLESVDE